MWTRMIIRFSLIAFVGVSIAALVEAGADANARKGKAYFKKNCRVCHDGNTEGVPVLQPADRIIEQWERAFKEKGEVSDCVPRVKDKTGVELTEQDLIDIQAYLVEGAADSEKPMTCG